MSEMIERCAQAMCDDPETRKMAGQENAPSFDDSAPHVQEYWRGIARAVLTALREPTPGMVASTIVKVENPTQEQREIASDALKSMNHFSPIGLTLAADLVRDWQNMIDAALESHP